MTRIRDVLALGLALFGTPSMAQRLSPPRFQTAAQLPRGAPIDTANPSVPAGNMVMAGVAGGVIGLVGGGYLGARIACALPRSPYGDDECGLAGAVYGGLAGEILGVPTGVFLANRTNGHPLLDGFVSAGIVFGGMAALSGAARDAPAVLFIGVPVLQLAGVVIVDRANARAHGRAGP